MTDSPLKFDDTATAFAIKSDRQLRKANFIFTIVNHKWVSTIATSALKLGLWLHLPIQGLIRTLVFDHFCGGENLEKATKTIQLLEKYNVKGILDYSVEGEKSDSSFDSAMEEICHSIDFASKDGNIPFCVFKISGVADILLLEKIQSNLTLSSVEKQAQIKFHERVNSICKKAHINDIPILIDAEQSWIQNVIDKISYSMMLKYNKQRAIIFNTFQMYRSDMLNNFMAAIQDASNHNYFLGAKIVRGAYLEIENRRAAKKSYKSPLHSSKKDTDQAFNRALEICLDNLNRVSFMCGSHNEFSNIRLTELMKNKGVAHSHKQIWFAQLLGMSDNISFSLSKLRYNVAKYIPYGPVYSVIPYLLRRAEENVSVAGQSRRELLLIRKEMERRKKGK